MSENTFLYLSRADVEQVALDLPAIIKLLEQAFLEKGQNRVEMPPKVGVHTQPDAFIHAMPAYIPSMRSAGMKWVGAYPENFKRGQPYITGLLALNDVETGLPYALMDCTWITAYRTGGATALAAKHLARPESSVIGILACGVQGRTNLLALATIFPLQRVYAYDISAEVCRRYCEEMSPRLKIEIIAVDEPRKAVVESDIVITAGPIMRKPRPTIEKDWLKAGAFASSVDFGSYWSPAALAQFEKLSTDDLTQYHYYKSIGYFDDFPEPYADLGQIVNNLQSGRETPDERTMAMNLGLALDDLAVAPEVYRRAKERGLGTRLPL
jgi:ornithine cyclodeaminase/alanine dehydrogenase-like protein (mu-crystallin family)